MKYFSILLLLTAMTFSGFSQSKDAILGRWVNPSGEAHVEISKRNNKYYGKMVWLKNPRDEQGVAKTDVKNPEPGLKSRPLLGLEILKDFVYDEGKWTDGKIYDPKSGKTYSCNITQKDANLISIRGYMGISIIGRSENWKRVK